MAWRDAVFTKIIEQLPIGVAVTLPTGILEYLNPCLCNLLGTCREEATGSALTRFISVTSEPLRTGARYPHAGRTQLRSRSGKICDVLESVHALRDGAGNVTHFVHIVQDVRAQTQSSNLSGAFYDGLTGLPNRNLLNDRLERTLSAARRKRSAFAVLYIGIDQFKQVNDALGHESADELLRQLALRLATSLRGSDSIGRWGADEFVALLEEAGDPPIASSIGHKLLHVCGRPYRLRGNTQRITLSMGMSFYPRDAGNIPALLEAANRAMLAVKTERLNARRIAAASGADPVLERSTKSR